MTSLLITIFVIRYINLCFTGSNAEGFGSESNKCIKQVKKPTFFWSIILIITASAPLVVTESGLALNSCNKASRAFLRMIAGTFSGSFCIIYRIGPERTSAMAALPSLATKSSANEAANIWSDWMSDSTVYVTSLKKSGMSLSTYCKHKYPVSFSSLSLLAISCETGTKPKSI